MVVSSLKFLDVRVVQVVHKTSRDPSNTPQESPEVLISCFVFEDHKAT